MKNHRINLVTSLITSFLIGCAGFRFNEYKLLKEPFEYEMVVGRYNFDNKKLPNKLKNVYNLLVAQGYNESFRYFLECVDRSDGIDDNYLTHYGLVRFRSREAFGRLDREEKRLENKFK